MGKSKKRIFNKNSIKKGNTIKRLDIIQDVISAIRNNNLNNEIKDKISLFGVSLEELSEAGATYEELSLIKPIIF